ncbi:hypothetical protein K502DRAFT_301096 [Neoconidiobolus thromboides FSU 785]|nr:hypothetical protein K502DRAFT_301096 [Neoconidiobolus thromboides FSU 785]
MARHSKNNTALGHFTYSEKSKTNYGSKKQRLGKDSLRKFDHCYLCLQKARMPLSCSKGHIACKECVVESIVTQRANLLKQSKLAEKQEAEKQKKEASKQLQIEQEKIEAFEKTQKETTSIKGVQSSNNKRNLDDMDEVPKSVKVESRKLGIGYEDSKLPAFWIPSMTPNMDSKLIEAPKNLKLTHCTAGELHSITLKKMIKVQLQTSESDESECPNCIKQLNNSMKPILLSPCGHVFCNNCTTKFIAPHNQCSKCGIKCTFDDLIYLTHDGTGFASGGGSVQVTKFGVAFQ